MIGDVMIWTMMITDRLRTLYISRLDILIVAATTKRHRRSYEVIVERMHLMLFQFVRIEQILLLHGGDVMIWRIL